MGIRRLLAQRNPTGAAATRRPPLTLARAQANGEWHDRNAEAYDTTSPNHEHPAQTAAIIASRERTQQTRDGEQAEQYRAENLAIPAFRWPPQAAQRYEYDDTSLKHQQ